MVITFTACARTKPLDGSEDDQMACLKPSASIGPNRFKLLHRVRAETLANDGHNDYQGADFPDGREKEDEVEFEDTYEDDDLCCD